MSVRVEHGDYGIGYVLFGNGGGKEGEYAQTDWDYPGAALSAGWNLKRVQCRNRNVENPKGTIVHLERAPTRGSFCEHSGTDGTVSCGCGVTVSDFIRCAAEYLDSKAD